MPEAPDAPRKMPRVIWHLGWISFFADVSSEMAYPIVPLFVSQVLRAPVAALGAIEGVAQAVVSIMKGWSGVQSDRIGRRLPFVQWGYGLSAIGKPLLAFTSVWPAVLGARSLDRLGKGLRTTARDALIADAADPRDYGKAFGLHSGLDTAGAFVGVMLLALLVWRGLASADFRNLFLWAGVPGLVSWFLTLLLREPRARDASEAKPPEAGKAAKRFDLKSLSPAYWRALGLSTLFALANSSDTFLLLRASTLGMSLLAVVLSYALYNVTYTLTTYPSGALSDRLGRWRLLAIGWVFYAIVYAGFAMSGAGLIWLLFALYGVYIGATQGVNRALIADLAPKDARGSALGLFHMSTGFATLLASLLGGWLWDRYGAPATFYAGSGLALVSAALIPLTRSK